MNGQQRINNRRKKINSVSQSKCEFGLLEAQIETYMENIAADQLFFQAKYQLIQ